MPDISEVDTTDLNKSNVEVVPSRRAMSLEKIAEPAPEDESTDPDNSAEDVSETDDDEDNSTDEAKSNKSNSEEESDDESDEDDDKSKKRLGFKERQRKKIEVEQIRRENQELKERLDRLERGEKPKQQEPQSTKSKMPEELAKEIDPNDFETHADYSRAVVRQETARIKWEDSQEVQAKQAKSAQQTVKEKLTIAGQKAGEKYGDDFLESAPQMAKLATPPVIEFLVELDDDARAEMLNYFGENQDEYRELVKKSPIGVVRALSKIAMKFEDESTETVVPKKQKSLPAPIKPLGKGSSKVDAFSNEKASYQDMRSALIKSRR